MSFSTIQRPVSDNNFLAILECHDESQNEHLVFNSHPKAIVATYIYIFHKKHVLMSCSCFASNPAW
jgi:hypothetical protein